MVLLSGYSSGITLMIMFVKMAEQSTMPCYLQGSPEGIYSIDWMFTHQNTEGKSGGGAGKGEKTATIGQVYKTIQKI